MSASLRMLGALVIIAISVGLVSASGSPIVYGMAAGLVIAPATLACLYGVVAIPRKGA